MAQLKDLIVNGPSRFIGDVYATTFTGNLAGNANTATSATNAGTVAGLSVHSGRNSEANKIVRTDGNGYLQVGYINSSSGHEKNASSPTYVWGSNSSDSYLRSYQTSSLSVNYATSSGSCSGNAATATKAGYLDTGTMTLYANGGNEINFGGTNTSSIIYFGYRATGSKPIPTSFIFGGSGTATLTAGGFKKKDSSASYVLTGDGGHAAISGLSVNYANSSGSCSGNAATATNASSAGNADKLDGVHYQNILERFYSGYSSSGTATGWFRIAETLIDDGIGPTFLLAIERGYSYTNNESYLFSISVSFGGGISITQLSGYANTRLITKIRVDWAYSQIAYVDLYIGSSSKTNDYFWYTIGCAKSYTAWKANPTLVGTAYEFTTVNGCKSDLGFNGYLRGTADSAYNWVHARTITLTGSVTGSVSIDGSANVTLATTTNHTHNYLPLSGGTMSNTNKVTNLNADLLDGYHASSFSLTSHTHSYIVTQGDNRSVATTPNDYKNKIIFAGLKTNTTIGRPSTSTYSYVVGIRGWSDTSGGKAHELAFNDDGIFHRIGATDKWEAWKQIAFLDSNVASATKLATSRTIWGQSFDGTGNVSGAMSDVEVINFADNWMTIGIVHNSSNVKDLVIQSEEAIPISISSGGLKLRISARDLDWGNNIIYHSGNCNFPTTPWNCSNLYAENSVSTIKGEFRYIEFSKTNSYSNNGGYIDFHFNGSTADYTSRIIEGLSGQLTVTGKLRVGLNDATSTNYAFHVVGDGYFTDNVITESDFISRGDAIIDGNVGIGTQRPDYNLDVYGNMRITGPICLDVLNSNGKYFISTENNGLLGITYDGRDQNPAFLMNSLGYVYLNCDTLESPAYPLVVNGTIQCTKLSQTSDIKYKTNIKQIEYEEALKIIENLNPVTWDWNENTVETGSSSGFVAQEAEEFIPNAISRDNENNLSLDYTQLHSYEIKVIQEQQKEIIKLKEKLKILEKLIS